MSHPPDPELLAITDEGGCGLNCDAVMRLTLDVDDAFLAATIVKSAHPRPRQQISRCVVLRPDSFSI
jgi:hypothetical protein